MNQYLVVWRPDVDMDADALGLSAHRVEGWSNDYAFFGHPQYPGEVTRLIPRTLVRSVELTHAAQDDGLTLQEAKRKWSGINEFAGEDLDHFERHGPKPT